MADTAPESKRAGEVFRAALRLGLSSFGGPVAHLGYYRRTYVERLRWLGEAEYAEIVALCQFLPGPASSQTGFLIGYRRAGLAGAFAAWAGFTLPSALLMFAFAFVAAGLQGPVAAAALHGLKLAAVCAVAQAVWSMARTLCPDVRRALLGLLALAAMLWLGQTAGSQVGVIAFGAAAGLVLCRNLPQGAAPGHFAAPSRSTGIAAAILFLALLGLLSGLATADPHGPAALLAVFYRAGCLVFGGGHVVLPLLREGLVPAGWIGDDRFLAGYGAAQALPGPLFAFSAYLGAAVQAPGWPAVRAALALCAIFVPGLLLVLAVAPFWARLRQRRGMRAAVAGINASVVGILAAALYQPVWTSAVLAPSDVLIATAGFAVLQWTRTPPFAVVCGCVATATFMGLW
jgi:chromate transporter